MTGIGIDEGLVKTSAINEEEQMLSKLHSVFEIKQIPEDNLGDAVSHISIFGIESSRREALMKLVQQEEAPTLVKFLQREELFIDIVVSKYEGYFHCMVIKSPANLQPQIDAFLNVIVSDN